MARLLYFNKREAKILAIALNSSRISCFTESQRAVIPDLARRLTGYILDGSTVNVNDNGKARKKAQKKLVGFAEQHPLAPPKERITDLPSVKAAMEEGKRVEAAVIASLRPIALLPEPKYDTAAFATLRGSMKPGK